MISNGKDTFLHYLVDNMTGIAIHPVRPDPQSPESSLFKMDAVNVELTDIGLIDGGFSCSVAIDVTYYSEHDALLAIDSLWTVLGAYQTPLIDYTDLEAPVTQRYNLFWDREVIRFIRVSASTQYCHFSCVFNLRFAQA